MSRPLKTCPGEHDTGAACTVCDEDGTICDMCWERGYPDECRTVATPERRIRRAGWEDGDLEYVVCKECYREHRDRVEGGRE